MIDVILSQGFTFLGMQYTSASFASAIMNAVPPVTFVLAVILRCFVNDIYKGPQIKLFFSPVTTHHQDGSHSPDEALRDCLSPPRLCRLVIFLHFTG
ncbi:hypothetical protein JHK86_014997 [Glycine max]|nr:hypothetical protein JHK86_014997 [Glycine max]